MESWRKSYSQLRLLKNKILQTEEKRGFFDLLFFGNQKYLTLNIPYFAYIRGMVFLDDLTELLEPEQEVTIYHLISVLYNDFAYQVKEGKLSMQGAADFLNAAKKWFLMPKVKERRELKQINEYVFSYETGKEIIEVQQQEEHERMTEITIRMKEDIIFRGEVFLNDVSPYLDEVITFEELLTLTYLHFIRGIQDKGNSLLKMENILDNLGLLDT